MGQIDDYLMAQVTPQLGPGEQIMALGLLRHPYRFNALLVPTHYEEWLATATNQRLILFRTENSGMFNVLTVKPKPMCQDVKQWWYQELQQVTTGTVTGIGQGISVSLVPHVPLGPFAGEGKRYDMFPQVEGLDGHGALYGQFGGWLQQQVAAGAFPMDPERQARVHAHQEQQRQEAERRRLAAEERRRKLKALAGNWRSFVLPSVAIVLLGGAIGLAVTAYFYFDDASSTLEHAKETEEIVKKSQACRAGGAKRSGSECHGEAYEKEQAGYAKQRRKSAEEDTIYGIVFAGLGGLVLLAGLGVGGLALARRKKAAAAAAATAGVGPAPQLAAGAPGLPPLPPGAGSGMQGPHG